MIILLGNDLNFIEEIFETTHLDIRLHQTRSLCRILRFIYLLKLQFQLKL